MYDPVDPMGKMFFNIIATFAEFEADLIRLRTREGMASRERRENSGASNPSSPSDSKRSCVVCMTTATIPLAIWPSCFRFPAQPCTELSLVSQTLHSAKLVNAILQRGLHTRGCRKAQFGQKRLLAIDS
ncbi:recombinase family protein [Paraburkholderia nemoris]|nr:recombinase family protein [Paraburkholderia nemoris]